jgi:hypothetical protein
MIVFVDGEFTDLQKPQLINLGLVTLDSDEFYVELDLASDIGLASKEFVRDQLLEHWSLVPGAACAMGCRAGEWRLGLAQESRTTIDVAFDYPADFELLERAVRDSGLGLWRRVGEVVRPVNIGLLLACFEADQAAKAAFNGLNERDLVRHHALADAWALRASFLAVQALQGGCL